MELDELLNGEQEPEVEVIETPTDVKEPLEAKEPEQETQEPEKESPSAPESETQVPLAAMHGERDRRKAAERERDELKAQLETKQAKEPTSVFEDENKFRNELNETFGNALTSKMLDFSERVERKLHGDEIVDSSIAWFKDAVQDAPLLKQRFVDSGNDVGEIVKMHQSHLEAEKLKDVDGYKAQLKAEARAEVEAELKADAEAKDKLRASVPDSLVGEASKGGLTSTDWSGPADISSIID